LKKKDAREFGMQPKRRKVREVRCISNISFEFVMMSMNLHMICVLTTIIVCVDHDYEFQTKVAKYDS